MMTIFYSYSAEITLKHYFFLGRVGRNIVQAISSKDVELKEVLYL